MSLSGEGSTSTLLSGRTCTVAAVGMAFGAAFGCTPGRTLAFGKAFGCTLAFAKCASVMAARIAPES